MRLYLDASEIIYSIESAPPFRDRILARISQFDSVGDVLLTSRLSRLECRVKPLREEREKLLSTYEEFFTKESVRVVEISPAIVEIATDLRVRLGFKTPDAIHLATAMEERADVFLTGDRALAKCTELTVEIL